MQYLSAKEIAEKFGVSPILVRRLCRQGRVPEAVQKKDGWSIPEDAVREERTVLEYTEEPELPELAKKLQYQKRKRNFHGLYDFVVIDLTYSSSRMASCRLTCQQVETIFPFEDGNGRVGRLIMFKECLRHDIMGGGLPWFGSGDDVQTLDLVKVEHIVIAEHGDELFPLFPGLLVQFLCGNLFPEHYQLGFFTFADTPAEFLDLIEGEVHTGLSEDHLIQQAVGLASGSADGPALHTAPRLLPGDAARFQLLNDAVRHGCVNVKCHCKRSFIS